MGLALVFFLISLVIGIIVFCFSKYDSENEHGKVIKHTSIGVIIAVFILGSLSTAIVVTDSYSSYLENRAFYDATIEQYRGAVKMYEDYAVIDMGKTGEAFTDFKYQGYQKEIANMIINLKRRIVRYNRSFILKKVKNAHWFFNWYIVANDPDMKIIRMIEKERPTAKKTGFIFLPNPGNT